MSDTNNTMAHDALHHAAEQAFQENSESVEDAVLVGFVLLGEMMDLEGNKWLVRIARDNGGEHMMPNWDIEKHLRWYLRLMVPPGAAA